MADEDPKGHVAPARERIYAIDWLRMYDVFIVVMGHCIRFLDDKPSDVKLSGHGKNAYLNVIMLFGNMWVMPLFFFLAGAAANLSISARTRMASYFAKRVLRIGIPLLGGFVLAVLPYAFIVRDYLDCNDTGRSDEAMSDRPWEFCGYYFSHCLGKHGFKWLWFLALLAAMTGVHLPIIFCLKRSVVAADQAVRSRQLRLLMLWGVAYVCGWGFLCGFGLPLHSKTLAGGCILYFTVTFGHVYCHHRKSDCAVVVLLLLLMTTHLFVQAEDKTGSSTMAKWLFITISYVNMFLSGFLVSLYEQQIAGAFVRLRALAVLTLFNFALFPLLAPVYEGSQDYVFVNGGVYATYPDRDMRILYGAGSYTWVLFIYAFARKYLNHDFHPLAYAYFTRSTLPLYVLHPTVQYALAVYWYLPYGQSYPSGMTFTSMCALSFFICYAFYTLIDVTPLRVLVGLTGPSPLFPDGLFRPSPLFAEGLKLCAPWCGFRPGHALLEEAPPLPSSRAPLGPAKQVVQDVVYGRYGLNELTKYDPVGPWLRHHEAAGKAGAAGAAEDWWSLPSTAQWRHAVLEHRRLAARVEELEAACDAAGLVVGRPEPRAERGPRGDAEPESGESGDEGLLGEGGPDDPGAP